MCNKERRRTTYFNYEYYNKKMKSCFFLHRKTVQCWSTVSLLFPQETQANCNVN